MQRRAAWLVAALWGASSAADAHPSERKALEHIEAEAAHADDPGPLHLARAEAYLRLRQPQDALEALATSELTSARAHVLAGRAYLALGRLEAAQSALDAAVRAAPEDLTARWWRAELASRRAAWAPAVADLERVIAAKRVTPGAFTRLAKAHRALGDHARAQVVLQKGLTRTGAAPLRRALVEIALERRDFAVARAEANRLVEAAPHAVQAYLLRAEVSAAAGDRAAARQDRRAALEVAERAVKRRGSAAALAWRATAKLAAGDEVGARGDARVALARAPHLETAQRVMEATR